MGVYAHTICIREDQGRGKGRWLQHNWLIAYSVALFATTGERLSDVLQYKKQVGRRRGRDPFVKWKVLRAEREQEGWSPVTDQDQKMINL